MNLANTTAAEKKSIQKMIDTAPFVLKKGKFEDRSSFVLSALAKHWEKPELFNPEKSSFRTYIFNNAKNLAIDASRSWAEKQNRNAVRISDTDKDGENVTHKFEKFLVDSSADFAANDSKTEQMAAFMAKLNTLPETAKKVVLMKLAGHKGQAIADALNITLGNVKATQNRAFHKIGMAHVLDNLKNLSQGYKEEKKTESSYMSRAEIAALELELA